jgi:hypothetical protein
MLALHCNTGNFENELEVYVAFIAFWGFVGQSICSVYLFPTHNARHVINGVSASPWQAQSGRETD